MAANSLKTGSECVLEHPEWSRVLCEKTCFQPFFETPFRFQNGPLEGLLGPNSASKPSKTRLKQPENVFLSAPNGLGSFMEKHSISAILDPIWDQLGPVHGWSGAKYHHLREKTGKIQPKGSLHVAQMDSVPSHSHQTPGGACTGAIGPRLGAVLGPNNTVDGVQTGKT